MSISDLTGAVGAIGIRELKKIIGRPIYWNLLLIFPLIVVIFFLTLVHSGVPTNMPIATVDLDMSSTSRSIVRNLDAFQISNVVAHYSSVTDARKAMQKGEIYGFFLIPDNFGKDVNALRRPSISIYTNDAYLVAGSNAYSEMKTMAVLASKGAIVKTLTARGVDEAHIAALTQPIITDFHEIGNQWTSYGIYLCNGFAPATIFLLIMIDTVYTIGFEIKKGTSKFLLKRCNDSIILALFSKLFFHFIAYLNILCLFDLLMYGFLGFPCNSGFFPMFLADVFTILASQGLALFFISIMPSLRLGLSAASLWGVMALSTSGISFPLTSMNPVLTYASNLFPMTHYLHIYFDQALGGYPLYYSLKSFSFLFIFMLLPLPFLFLLKRKLKEAIYKP